MISPRYASDAQREPVRIGAVEYLNTTPLVDGLDACRDVRLFFAPPSRLIDLLVQGEVDVALCSTIDYLHSPVPLVILPVGQLGSTGATLSVCLFSSIPPGNMTSVHCDTDSHTSVVLLQVLLARRYGIHPRIIHHDFGRQDPNGPRPEAMLVIGDKALSPHMPGNYYPWQMDLGHEWYDMTGLPCIFGIWMAKSDMEESNLSRMSAILDRQRRKNMSTLDSIVHRYAARHGWPATTASEYLSLRMQYTFGDKERRGLALFFSEAQALGLAEDRPLSMHEGFDAVGC